jgi:hypothetical protein
VSGIVDDLIEMLKKERLEKGKDKYGEINLFKDKRNFPTECLEEVIDALWYAKWSHEVGQISEEIYLKIDKALRDVATMLLSGQA